MKSGLFLNIVVSQGSVVLELFSGEDESLLIRRDSFLVLDFRLHILNRIRRLDLKRETRKSSMQQTYCTVLAGSSSRLTAVVYLCARFTAPQ